MSPTPRIHKVFCATALVLAVGCAGRTGTPDGSEGGTGGTSFAGPTKSVTATEAIPSALTQALDEAAAMDGDALTAAYPAPEVTALGYDATQAAGMDLIQGSALSLDAAELDKLRDSGLVISKRQEFPSFAYGYKSIYADDLPVYVSADSILEAVHRTFDTLLAATEEQVLIGELREYLRGMRARLPGRFEDTELAADADLYLAVALSLLEGTTAAPVMGADAGEVASLVSLATAGSGHDMVELFGAKRDEDFSQFKPRGHYTDSEALQRYFRAMMWLGRVDLRIVETQSDGSQVFRRRQFDAAVALWDLMGDPEHTLWNHIDATIGAYVGERDSMSPTDMSGMLGALGVGSLSEALALDDDAIIAELASGGWGAQRIASRIIIKGNPSGEPLPLDRSFLLFGQRYTVDSHTFVNTTYDRVGGRMMPKPLDAAFAALGNGAALPRLASELGNQSYVAGLAKTRALVDAHEDAYWEGSVYTRWLGALRALSPDAAEPPPGVPQTAAWQSRVLGAQLGSWSELRHDTILYVKQSYTGGAVCEFPDAYVDPYPAFYAKLGALAEAIAAVADTMPPRAAELATQTRTWATTFGAVVANLEAMAKNQLTGAPHSQELIDFINDAVSWDEEFMCGGVMYSNLAGWYLRLYLDESAGLEYDPVVADVHTQPTDAGGADVGRILHVGTGRTRLMVVTAETCLGPRAYAGLAFSYGELVKEDWVRLNDEEWAQEIAGSFPDPEWMGDVLAP